MSSNIFLIRPFSKPIIIFISCNEIIKHFKIFSELFTEMEIKMGFIVILLKNRHTALDAESPDICDELWRLRVKPAMMGL